MTPEEADAAQDWQGMDGAVAWQLIDRHALNWHDVGEMMDAWMRANGKSVRMLCDEALGIMEQNDPLNAKALRAKYDAIIAPPNTGINRSREAASG